MRSREGLAELEALRRECESGALRTAPLPARAQPAWAQGGGSCRAAGAAGCSAKAGRPRPRCSCSWAAHLTTHFVRHGAGKDGGGEDAEDTYGMLRKLAQLQRMAGRQARALPVSACRPAALRRRLPCCPLLPQPLLVMPGAVAADMAPAIDSHVSLNRKTLRPPNPQGGDAAGGEGEGGGGGSLDEAAAIAEATVQAGCTAVVALIVRDQLYVANAGDSRAVLCRGGKALPMSGAGVRGPRPGGAVWGRCLAACLPACPRAAWVGWRRLLPRLCRAPGPCAT